MFKYNLMYFISNMATVQLSLQVSASFRVPSVYKEGTQAEIEEALAIGAFVQDHVRTQKATETLRTAIARKDVEWSAQVQEKEKELNKLHEEYTNLQQLLAKQRQELLEVQKETRRFERDAVTREYEDQLRALQNRCDALDERRRMLETSRDADILATEKRTRELMQQVVAVREEQVRKGETALAAFHDAYRKQIDELQGLNDFLRRKITNVKTKGNEYEGEFRDLLLRAFHTCAQFSLSDTNRNGVGHAGDFLMRMEDHTVLWEVKNYDRPVPKSEVEKFQRDMKENGDVTVGVMVSRYTDITGRTSQGDRELEFSNGKLLIYMSRFEMMGDTTITLQTLLPLFRIWWELGERECEDEASQLQDAIREIEKLLGDLGRKRTEWRLHKSRMEETIRWMSEVVENSESNVNMMLKRIRGHNSTIPTDLPTDLFRSTLVDEKVRDTIGFLLEECSICADGEIRLSELSDILSLKKKTSRETARKYVLAALMDTAVIAAPGKPTIIRGLQKKV